MTSYMIIALWRWAEPSIYSKLTVPRLANRYVCESRLALLEEITWSPITSPKVGWQLSETAGAMFVAERNKCRMYARTAEARTELYSLYCSHWTLDTVRRILRKQQQCESYRQPSSLISWICWIGFAGFEAEAGPTTLVLHTHILILLCYYVTHLTPAGDAAGCGTFCWYGISL